MSDRVPMPFDPVLKQLDSGEPGDHQAWHVDEHGLVYLRCKCGLIMGSPKLHLIDADGTVNASIVCDDRHGCGWHVFCRLLDWIDGALPAGAAKIAEKRRSSLEPCPREAEVEH